MKYPASKGAPDANQAAIVEAYETLGCSVIDLHSIGYGTPDLLIGFGHRLDQLVEVKIPGKKLKTNQLEFAEAWRGRKPIVVRSVDDVERHVQRMHEILNRSLFAHTAFDDFA